MCLVMHGEKSPYKSAVTDLTQNTNSSAPLIAAIGKYCAVFQCLNCKVVPNSGACPHIRTSVNKGFL